MGIGDLGSEWGIGNGNGERKWGMGAGGWQNHPLSVQPMGMIV